MQKILSLLKDGKSRSIENLATELGTSNEDIKRKIDFLERNGYIRCIGKGCGGQCKNCSSCNLAARSFTALPVFWEIIKKPHLH